MANRNKFEEMLERLINEDKEGAEELFHEIVVEKSRDIYESLLEADLEDEEVDETTDEEVDESDDEEVDESDDEEVEESDDELDEDFNLDEFEVEADPMDMAMDMGGDETDDMMGDVDMGDDEEGEEGDMEDRVEDLEDALDELKAEFEKMLAGEEGEDHDMGGDEEEEDEEGEDEDEGENPFESTEDEVEESRKPQSAGEQMREYVEKVNATMGDNGANTKSTVAGKNDMGGTAANIAKGGESKSEGTQGGLAAPTAKEDNAGNVNVPGAKGATKTSNQPGHGAEKKGKPENAENKKSVVGK